MELEGTGASAWQPPTASCFEPCEFTQSSCFGAICRVAASKFIIPSVCPSASNNSFPSYEIFGKFWNVFENSCLMAKKVMLCVLTCVCFVALVICVVVVALLLRSTVFIWWLCLPWYCCCHYCITIDFLVMVTTVTKLTVSPFMPRSSKQNSAFLVLLPKLPVPFSPLPYMLYALPLHYPWLF